jgi:hypothetical protein
MNNIYYIPVNTTLFPAGGVRCLGTYVSAHIILLSVEIYITNATKYK